MSRREQSPSDRRLGGPAPEHPPGYADRTAAGHVLADRLARSRAAPDLVVLALPRGGVPVAAPVAARLGAALGVLAVRKVSVPGRPELAMGALALLEGEVQVLRNESVIQSVGIAARDFTEIADREASELLRRSEAFAAAQVPTQRRTVVVVDDGLATGSTMLSAVTALRRTRPRRLVVAAPVGAAAAIKTLSQHADEVVCPWVPDPFRAVGYAYDDFTQVADIAVRRVLENLPLENTS